VASELPLFSRRRPFAPRLLVGSGLGRLFRFSGTGGFCFTRSVIRPLLVVFFSLGMCRPLVAALPVDPRRFDKEIAAFDRHDTTNPPPQRPIVFVGSSSIRLWPGLPGSFPNLPVLNRGFGGSQLSDVLFHLDRTVLRYRPSRVVLYAGDNDLAEGRSPETIAAEFETFVSTVRDKAGPIPIDFLAIKPSPKRLALLREQMRANRLVSDVARRHPDVSVIDVFSPLLDPRGEPDEKLFAADRLHLGPAGYALWNRVVGEHLTNARPAAVGGPPP
jgi:lysophospholipase L1-like esterase